MSDIKCDYLTVLYALDTIRKELEEVEKIMDRFYFLLDENPIDYKKKFKEDGIIGCFNDA